MHWRYSWVSFFVAALLFSSTVTQAQSSQPIFPGSEPLWQSLNQMAKTLPNSYDLFLSSLTGQISLLQDNVTSLQDSNDNLKFSNNSLTLRNADLQNSLLISQAAAATSESKSESLQKALDDSIQSITRAEADAKALQFQNTLLKYGAIVGGVVAIVAVIVAIVK